MLQDFQERFIREIQRLANSVPKAMFEYDTWMPLMKWRIAHRKLIFMNKILAKPVDNITRRVLINFLYSHLFLEDVNQSSFCLL